MPTNHDETLHERYAREHQAHLAIYARMTPEQISDMATELHNALARLAALSQQAEPVRSPGTEDTASMDSNSAQEQFTAVDMATAAAQGFRDGQAAVEPAPAQDERDAHQYAFEVGGTEDGNYILMPEELDEVVRRANESYEDVLRSLACSLGAGGYNAPTVDPSVFEQKIRWGIDQLTQRIDQLTRPAQTEQQPYAWVTEREGDPTFPRLHKDEHQADHWVQACNVAPPIIKRPLYAAPIAQAAPQGKFRMGDLVKKSSGSEWVGRVVGWYSTEQTAEGYAVESSAHRNSVQIYPVTALEAVE